MSEFISRFFSFARKLVLGSDYIAVESERNNQLTAIVIDRNGLFFDDIVPQFGEPQKMTSDAIRGSWIAFGLSSWQGDEPVSAHHLAVYFGTDFRPAWTLNESGTLVANPDGDAAMSIHGYGIGEGCSAMGWGWNDNHLSGWMASPFAGPPFDKSLMFELLRGDLLRVRGEATILCAEARIGLDVVLVPDPVTSNRDSAASASFSADDWMSAPQDDDPVNGVESPIAFRGTWIHQSGGQKTTLSIADHRLMHVRQQTEGKEAVCLWLLQFNRAEHALEIILQSISPLTTFFPIDQQELRPKSTLKLTQQGRLLYFGEHPTRALVFNREDE